ncbi:MAG: ABC transporter ATP-binding protein [Syntrophus sp. (in: bacteria)]|nr:ABC transporter ATP-binding protein [Syntrophus sp. (in: bacteria)]
MLMQIRGLTVNYGAINALNDVFIDIEKGEIISVIGANGAGKSTFLKTITGIVKARAGSIELEGKNIHGLRPDRIVRLGVTMVPEGRRVFPDLSVKENLELGGYTLRNGALKKELFDLVLSTFPRLQERLKQHAGTLSGGEQQMLAMGRALMGNPKLLLLDEPSMGLSPIITREIFTLIRLINRERGISIILVEQNAHMALEHSRRTYVLENGRIVMEGKSGEIKGTKSIIDAYLGV